MGLLTTEYCDEQLALVDAALGSSTVAGPLNGAKLILATDMFAPGKLSTTASFTQPTTTSFTPPTLTWTAAVRDQAGMIVTLSQTVTVQSADGVDLAIYGYGVTDPGGTHLLFSEVFESVQNLPDALAYFLLTLAFAPGAPSSVGADVGS